MKVDVPLTGVVVEAKVEDFLAQVTIKQRYENVENDPIEAIYEFPLAEGASVSSFYAIVDGKRVDGKLKEKEEAKNDYDDAIAGGHSAFLLEEGVCACVAREQSESHESFCMFVTQWGRPQTFHTYIVNESWDSLCFLLLSAHGWVQMHVY